MAPSLAKSNTPIIFSLFLLSIIIAFPAAAQGDQPQETNFVVFFHITFKGPDNVTDVAVAGVPGEAWRHNAFGTIFVNDNYMTETMDRNSPKIGHGHGIYVVSTMDASSLLISESLWFTGGEYRDSTLELHGTSFLTLKYREIGVVAGTGKFRFVRGYATFETVLVDIIAGHATVRVNLTLLQ
ncbi:Dirigent protein [Dillenia turbinata]|uniref:Dirigent protein n=1 Tax=Dillenia turbinata TaxID=194707 RepID=A0AAN8WEW4_9MAGN